MATINNVSASWSMIQLKISNAQSLTDGDGENALLVNCTAISWNASRKSEVIYGLGGQPRGRGFGNVEYSASITLPYETQEFLAQKSPDGTLMGLGSFDLVITWTDDLYSSSASGAAQSFYSVTLKDCFFSEQALSVNQDDTSITHEYDLHPYRIYNAKNSADGQGWSSEMYSR